MTRWALDESAGALAQVQCCCFGAVVLGRGVIGLGAFVAYNVMETLHRPLAVSSVGEINRPFRGCINA